MEIGTLSAVDPALEFANPFNGTEMLINFDQKAGEDQPF